jgi:hypothetical protein
MWESGQVGVKWGTWGCTSMHQTTQYPAKMCIGVHKEFMTLPSGG